MNLPTGGPGASAGGGTVGILVTDNRRRGAEVQAERSAEGLAKFGWNVEFRSLVSSPEPVVEVRPLTRMRRVDLARFDPDVAVCRGPECRYPRARVWPVSNVSS